MARFWSRSGARTTRPAAVATGAVVATVAIVCAVVGAVPSIAAAAAPASSPPSAWISLYSTPGDGILGGGHLLLQPSADLSIQAWGSPGALGVTVSGSTSFLLLFAPVAGQALSVGYYPDAQRSADSSHPEIDIGGRGIGCNFDDGEFVINDIGFANGTLSRLDMTFVQHCERALPALFGQISYNEPAAALLVQASSLDFPSQYVGVPNVGVPLSLTNTTILPIALAAVNASGRDASDVAITANDCPVLLAAGATCSLTATVTPHGAGLRLSEIDIFADLLPVSVTVRDTGIAGNGAFTLDSAPGDTVGGGQQLAYNQFNSTIASDGSATEVDVNARAGDNSLYASVVAPAGHQLVVGDYPDAEGVGGPASAHAGLQISTNLAGTQTCQAVSGRFRILEIAFDGDGRVTHFAADLEQHCFGGPALFTSIRLASTIGYSALAVQPTTDLLTYPSILPGNPSPRQQVRVSNVGVDPVSFTAPAVTGANAPDFQAGPSTCAGGPIAPGASCTMSATFTPHDFGARTASLAVSVSTPRGQLAVALAGTGAPAPAFTFPVDGQNNADNSQPFTWATSPQADGYYLIAGTTPGGTDLVNSGILPPSQSSYVMPGLPQAVPIHATLFTRSRGHWDFHQTITFSAFATAARFTYPLVNMANVDPARPITWSAHPQALGYRVLIGTEADGAQLFDSGQLPASQSSLNPPPLPANTTLYALIVTEWVGYWQPNSDFVTFVIHSGQATFTNPLNGRTVANPPPPYTWTTAPQAQGYWLVVTTASGAVLVNSGVLPATRSSFPGRLLPPGAKLYATVFTKIGGSWSQYQTVTFNTA